jgi:hypothetical protein
VKIKLRRHPYHKAIEAESNDKLVDLAEVTLGSNDVSFGGFILFCILPSLILFCFCTLAFSAQIPIESRQMPLVQLMNVDCATHETETPFSTYRFWKFRHLYLRIFGTVAHLHADHASWPKHGTQVAGQAVLNIIVWPQKDRFPGVQVRIQDSVKEDYLQYVAGGESI